MIQGGKVMPTVMRHEGFRLYFYSHEPNEPQHVHVDRGSATAKIWLTPVAIAHNMGFSARELGELLRLVRANRVQLMEAWNGHFGVES
jgi:hypothetical protein